MKSAAAANAAWCRAWDEATDALLEQLSAGLDPEGVHDLLRTRQRLMTANPGPSPGRAEAEQRRWLEAAAEREAALRTAFEDYRARIRAARHTMRGNEVTRRRFGVDAPLPAVGRFDRRI